MNEITIAIAGNPNSGKTTIFNALTGTKQKTGNWPGVTVEKKEGTFKYNNVKIKIVDLPGTYSLSGNSIDEKIARDFIINNKPDIVLIVADSLNIERSLNLTVQILETCQKVILDLNMIDVAKKNGIEINTQELSKILKCTVVETIGHKGKGIEELKNAIISSIKTPSVCLKIHYKKDVEEIIKKIEEILWKMEVNIPLRFLAIKILSKDPDFIEIIKKKKSSYNKITKILKNLPEDIENSIEESRYAFVHGIYKEVVKVKTSVDKRMLLSDRIDKVLTNRFLGLPIFLSIIFLTFLAVFKIGTPIANLLDQGFTIGGNFVADLIIKAGGSQLIVSFIRDGIIGGVGSIVVFLPNIFLLFLIFAILEDSGYMARAAFVMDKIMHLFGLHGKSFIPMILGFGCNVPAIMGTRILETEKDRILTILIIPLMSCSARLPIYILFAGIFFAGNEALVIFSLYLLGIILAIFISRLFKSLFFKKQVAPLIIELPMYRLPSIKNIFIIASTKSALFLRKAGTFILLAAVVVWGLASLPPGVKYGSANSIIASVGKFIAPIFKPLGFGFWQSAVALIFGVFAKELVVGTLGSLLSEGAGLKTAIMHYFTPLSSISFMVMSLLYFPCIATFAVIKKEAGWRWAIISAVYTIVLAWIVSFLVYNIGKIFI